MTLLFMYSRIVGIIFIAIGCLFLTRKKIIISQQYDMIFLCTLVFSQLAIKTIWSDQDLLIIAAFYLFFVIFSFIIMKGRYDITNIKKGTLMPIITNLLDEKIIVYEVIDNSVVLTNYDNKKIKYREFINYAEISFRGIRRLPFYGDIKDSLISRTKLIKETVFPTTGVFLIATGIIFIVMIQVLANSSFITISN